MLDLLLDYAVREGLVCEPGFAPKDVRFLLDFDVRGRFTGVFDFKSKDKGGTQAKRFPACPHLSTVEVQNKYKAGAHFLVEDLQYSVGLIKEDSSEGDRERILGRRKQFIRMLKECCPGYSGLCEVADTLADEAQAALIRKALIRTKAKPADKATLRIDGKVPVEGAWWHEPWRAFRRSLSDSTGTQQRDTERHGEGLQAFRRPLASSVGSKTVKLRCLATGSLIEPLATHDKIKGLGTPEPSLIGFDKDAFTSYGLLKSANAAVGAEAAAAYRAALNRLIETGVSVAGSRLVHWFSKAVPLVNDPLAFLAEGDETGRMQEKAALARVTELLEAVQSGKMPEIGSCTYYALSLYNPGGRVMLRDFHHGSFESLVGAVKAWFQDLEICRFSGGGLASAPKLERLVTALLPLMKPKQDYKDWVRPVGLARTQLLAAALDRNRPIPLTAIGKIAERHRAFVVTTEFEDALKNGQDTALVISLLQARMGLLKAYNNRANQKGYQMGPNVNEDHPSPAYHCGRLMAVYSALQRSALGDVGTGVVERYYGAASTTPSLVLGRLAKLSQFHLAKLEPGLAHHYGGKLARIGASVGGELPRTLSLHEQTLFALGYYQQAAADWPRRKDGPTANAELSNIGDDDNE